MHEKNVVPEFVEAATENSFLLDNDIIRSDEMNVVVSQRRLFLFGPQFSKSEEKMRQEKDKVSEMKPLNEINSAKINELKFRLGRNASGINGAHDSETGVICHGYSVLGGLFYLSGCIGMNTMSSISGMMGFGSGEVGYKYNNSARGFW